MSLKACLVIAALFGSVSVGSAVPNCPSTFNSERKYSYIGLDECYGSRVSKFEARDGYITITLTGKFRWITVEEHRKFIGQKSIDYLKKTAL